MNEFEFLWIDNFTEEWTMDRVYHETPTKKKRRVIGENIDETHHKVISDKLKERTKN